jgi:hypothetical protein
MAKFATKKYTGPVLVSEVKKLSVKNFVDFNTFVNAFSPRAGRSSAKFAALKNVLGNDTIKTTFAISDSKSNKSFLLNALRIELSN